MVSLYESLMDGLDSSGYMVWNKMLLGALIRDVELLISHLDRVFGHYI